MPRVVNSLSGRVVLLGVVVGVVVGFSLWFLSPDALFSGSARRRGDNLAKRDQTEPMRPFAPLRPTAYPSLQKPLPDGGTSYGAEPDFDPLGQTPTTQTRPRGMLDLLQRLPDGHSVLGILDVARLRKYRWANSILTRRRLPRLRRYLDRIGFDPTEAGYVAFGVDLETRAGASRGKQDPRFLGGRYDRPFCLIAVGDIERRALLRRFRQPGPLAAAMVMGRRVYRRAGDYGLSFPVRDVVVWSYRRPMGPVLQVLLEDVPRAALTVDRRRLLRQAGLPLTPPAPLVALVWTPQPKRRVPWPMNRLGGSSLRGAVLTVRSKGKHLIVDFRLLLKDARAIERTATLLRYIRHIVAQKPVFRRTLLKPVIEALPIRVSKSAIQITAEVRPWHARALMAVLHKLIEQ